MNAHFLQCRVSSNTSVRVLQTAFYNQPHCAVNHFKLNFTKLVPHSIRCFIIGESRISYLNKCNRLDIIIFRL